MSTFDEATKKQLDDIFERGRGQHKSQYMPPITLAEVEFLLRHNYAAHIYPRKKQVCVNGHKYYRLIKEIA